MTGEGVELAVRRPSPPNPSHNDPIVMVSENEFEAEAHNHHSSPAPTHEMKEEDVGEHRKRLSIREASDVKETSKSNFLFCFKDFCFFMIIG